MHQVIFASKNGVIQRIISLTPLRSAYEQTSESIFRTLELVVVTLFFRVTTHKIK